MAGRHRLPLNVIDARGRTHLTKRQKATRRKSEIKMPDGKITCPAFVRKNKDAKKKWREVVDILNGADLLKPADVGALARYCMIYSEWVDLVNIRNQISEIDNFSSCEVDIIVDEFENGRGKKAAEQMWKKVEFIFSVNGKLAIDKAINQKAQILLSLEDHFCLNILARTKITIPEKDAEPEKSREDKIFGF